MLVLLALLLVPVSKIIKTDARPRNVAVVVGEPMRMTCESPSNDVVHWKFKYPGQIGEITLHNASRGFFVTKPNFNRIVSLGKSNTSRDDAGIYTCVRSVNQSGASIHSAELLVLLRESECGASVNVTKVGIMEGTIIQMWCRVIYIGNMSPVMTLLPGGTIQNESFMIDESSINASTEKHKTNFYNTSIRLNSSDNGSVFGFKCHFVPQIANGNSQVVKARNIPDYVYKWNFTAVVYYGPRNISIEPLKQSYEYGNNLHCHSDGNPPSNYKWMSRAAGSVEFKDGSTFTIDESLSAGVMHSYQCIATNGISKENVSITVNITVGHRVSHGSGHTSQPILILVILLPILGAIVIFNVGLIVQKRILRRRIIEVNANYEGKEQICDAVSQAAVTYEQVTTTTQDIFVDETLLENELPDDPSYSNLTGIRDVPAPVIYCELENDNSTSNKSETLGDCCSNTFEHYANVSDIHALEKV